MATNEEARSDTDAELWHTCRVPQWLLDQAAPGASARQLRLVACDYVRSAWDLLDDPRSRHALEVAERFADGEVGPADLEAAHDEAALSSSAEVSGRPVPP